jgi:glycosyltransferase involved in cell wall biosynthesis
MAKQFTVNYGMFPDQLLFTPYDKCERNVMVYAGGVSWWSGLDLVIDAMPELLESCPETVLKVIGRGDTLDACRERVRELGLEQHVVFDGYIADPEEVRKRLSPCAFALALYSDVGTPDPNLESTKKYGDVIKIRTYLACGLPIVVTDVPFSAREVRDRGAGIMVEYDKDAFVSAARQLLTDEGLNTRCRAAARKMAEENTWERNYDWGMAAALGKAGDGPSAEERVDS